MLLSGYCSLGCLEGLVHYCTMTEDQGDPWAMGNSTILFQGLARNTAFLRLLPRCNTLESNRWRLFFPPFHSTCKSVPDHLQFQWFLRDPPRLSFKKLIVLTPYLRQELHTMSLAKAVPGGLRNCECERTAVHEPPPVPYVTEKDEV